MKIIIVYSIILLAILDIILFSFLLVRKIINKILDGVKEKRADLFTREIDKYISDDREKRVFKRLTTFDLKILEGVIFDYIKYLKGNSKLRIVKIAKNSGIVDKNIKRLKSGPWWIRANGANKLGVMEIKEAIPLLIQNLNSNNYELMFESAEALIRISGTSHLKNIIYSLCNNSRSLEKRILDLIDGIEEDIYESMKDLIENGEDNHKVIGLKALGYRKDYRVIPFIVDLINHKNKEVRIATLIAAEKIGDIGDLKYFYKIISKVNDESWEVRYFLAKTLRNFFDRKSIETLEKLIKDDNYLVGHSAGESLLQQGDEGKIVLSQLLLIEDDKTKRVVWELIQREIVLDYLSRKSFKTGDNYTKFITNVNLYKMSIKKGDNNGMARSFS